MTRLAFICQGEGIEAEDSALEAISRYVSGGMRDAINLVEQLSVAKKLEFAHVKEILGLSSLTFLEEFYSAITGTDVARALAIVDETYHQGIDLRQFTHEFIDLLRKKMLASVYENKAAEAYRLSEIIAIFQDTQQNMEASIPQLPLEIAVVRAMIKIEQKVKERAENEVAIQPVMAPAPTQVVAPAPVRTVEKIEAVAAPEVLAPAVAAAVVSEQERVHKPIVSGDLSIEKIRENWPRVSERIKNPALRISLKDAKIDSLDEHGITLKFSTQFHCDKICETANKSDLELILREVFGSYLKVIAVVKSLEIVTESAPIEPRQDSSPTTASSMEDAMSIFGGEIVS